MSETTHEITTLLSGLAMGESARWHDGRFWCSDWVAGEILAAEVTGPAAGRSEVVARSASFPFCFDWQADGTMLVTGGAGLERLEPTTADEAGEAQLVPHADLSALGPQVWNEVIVDPRGNAYVNSPNFDMSGGFDFEVGSRSGVVALVTPDGDTRIVATEVAFPNGMAVTPDGSTLIVAESFASRLGAWDIDPDGGLSNRRVWAEVEHGCDGISIDAEGAVWIATQTGCERVREGGEVADRIPFDLFGFSCALGGPDGRTLFMVAAEWSGYENIGKGPRTGVVYAAEVEVSAPRF
ncbi:MAG TPA: SMP-30/gluconolactonase/LRE family protein [Acidimicrobiales bacterium]|nr:SMP-30/gluconolactonase/LRE family protein [Acidimicrobiales bacterium]